MFFTVLLGCVATATAQTAQSDVQATLDALDSWLAESDNGPGWHAYLKTDQLQEQLNQGEQADAEILQQQLDLYSGSNSGLRKPRFKDVREALEAWIDELKLPAKDALADQAKAAAEDLTPVDPEQLAQAKQRLESATEQFDRYIKRGGEAKEAGWKAFLRWDDLIDELKQESPSQEKLVQSWALLASDAPGLSYAEFTRLRDALGEFVALNEYFADEQNAIENLPDRLAKFSANANEQTTADLGQTLGWLERSKQADDVVQGLRRHYAKPNLYMDVSSALVVYGFASDVDETDPISNYSNGNSTSGTGHTIGKITAALTPNGSRGEVTVSMDGQIDSKTRTNNSQGVSFNTNGVTTIDAEKLVYFTPDGLRDNPAEAHCVTDNTTFNIRATSAQVESIARQRIAERERSSEYESARRAESQVETKLNSRVREQLQDANERVERDFFGPMARRGVKPRFNKFNSTSETLYQRMILAAPEHLAAPNNPPDLKVDGDVVTRVHASWLNNLADISLRGSLLTDVGLAEALEQWRGDVPKELQVTDESEPWDITYAARRPLWIELDKDSLRVTLRGQRFTARDRVMNEAMHISANYKVKRAGGKISLVRDGEVEVSFPEQGEKLSVRYVTMRRFWQTKFSALFTEEFDELDLRLRGAWESAGPLKLTALGVRNDGWIGLAWKMPEPQAGDGAAEQAAAVD
jgi:hypothetical protein